MCEAKFILIFFSIDTQSFRLGNFVGVDDGRHLQLLSSYSSWFNGHFVGVRFIRCNEPCCMGHCLSLRDFLLLPQFRRSDQLVPIASIVATNFKAQLFHLFAAFPGSTGHNGNHEIHTIFQWIYRLPCVHRKLCAKHLRCRNRNVGIWITNCCNWKAYFQSEKEARKPKCSKWIKRNSNSQNR